MMKYALLLVFLSFFLITQAQSDSCWSVLIYKKGRELNREESRASYSSTGFYLYRNCLYEIKSRGREFSLARLIDIRPDTLLFSSHFNPTVASRLQSSFDTLAIHYRDLERLRLISDRTFGIYRTVFFENFEFEFLRDTLNCSLPSRYYALYRNDSTQYELAPYLTDQGVELLYEEGGHTFYFYGGGLTRPDPALMDRSYDVRNGVWFTPCKVEKINGVSFGMATKNIKNDAYRDRDSLQVNGLDLEINPFGVFILMNPHFVGPYPDSLPFYEQVLRPEIETHIYGMRVSLTNTIHEMELKGVNVTGMITLVDRIEGLSISGISNFSYEMNGATVSIFYNRATSAKGVQVGLINKATDLRGFQIGLWNTNGRRSLPLINWQFKPAKAQT